MVAAPSDAKLSEPGFAFASAMNSFVVLAGKLTMLLGDPPERVDVGPHSVVAVEPMTPLQIRNESDEELILFIYGAPPEQAGADFFDDVEPPAR